MTRSAEFDPTGKYRYTLSRIWDADKPIAIFVMLNPSTANAEDDDPTIRRCIRFAQDWGYGGLRVVNLFALVSSDPAKLVTEPDAVGEENDMHIIRAINQSGIVIAAWGSFKEARKRAREVLAMLRMGCCIYCLGQNSDGSPKHPLYIPAAIKPQLMKGAL
jgi:Uncharacterized protein conserved in bacteria